MLVNSRTFEGFQMEGIPTPQRDFVDEAMRVLEEARKRGIVLRVMGAIAVRLHCPNFVGLHKKMGREISDMDFVGYERQGSKIEGVFKSLGYTSRPLSYSFRLTGRLIFLDDVNARHVDVFLDRLAMCHTIDFSKRLEVDYPTIPLAELLLQKMQIVKLSEKDVKDAIVLLREHDLGDGDSETINVGYAAKLLTNDWGFYYTATMNLKKVRVFTQGHPVLSEEDRQDVIRRTDQMLAAIKDEPKSLSWKMRARLGPSKKWYREVDTPKG